MGKISADGFERRFALACRPQGTCKDEINRLFAARHINTRTFCDCTELDETMYYRLKSKDEPPTLPLPDMYGKNLTFKTGGVDGCRCAETLELIARGQLDTTPLITHSYPLREIEAAYELFENRRDGVVKVAIEC